jgi:hypothetical protein
MAMDYLLICACAKGSKPSAAPIGKTGMLDPSTHRAMEGRFADEVLQASKHAASRNRIQRGAQTLALTLTNRKLSGTGHIVQISVCGWGWSLSGER